MSVDYNPRVVTHGLVLALDAGNTKSYPGSGTAWTDLSGQGNNGTLYNMSNNFDTANGGSLTFDGTDENVEISSFDVSTLMNGLNNFSISLWINSDSFPASTNSAISPIIFDASSRYLYLVFGDSAPADQFSVRVNQNSTWQSPVQNNSALSNGTWYNMFVTYNSSSGYILYQNGTSVDTSNTTGSITSFTNTDIRIGGSGGAGSTRYYDGKISQTLIYNKTLTAAEVEQSYNALKGRYGL